MWYALRKSAKTDPDFASSAVELLQSTSRGLILVTGGACPVWFFWHTVVALKWLDDMVLADPIALVTVITCALALWLVAKQQLLAAQAAWQLGIVGVIALALYILQQPEIALLYALLPWMAVVTVGWPAGILSEGLVIALVWCLSRTSLIPPLPAAYGQMIIMGGAFTGLLGWAATRTFLAITRQFSSHFEQIRSSMEEARQHRLELEQVREDLIHANQELAHLSDRLEAMYQVAEEARQAKQEFVANVSHELRTPLNMVISFSEMITQSPELYGDNLPPALLADVGVIQRNSQYLAKLVDDILDLSQIDAGRMAISKEWTTISEIAEEVVASIRALFEAKGLFLELDIEPDIPPLFCDSTRIKEVLINLLTNAQRFTERGGVWVRGWHKEDSVVIGVTDTGPGIPPEAQVRIFEPFQQLDTSIRRRYGGSGLGLSISKRFVEMHKGKMWIESPSAARVPFALGTGRGGRGTTIYFSLPLSAPSPAIPAGDDVARWIRPSWEYHVRTRPFKAPVPEPVSRFVILEKGGTLQRLFNRYMDEIEVCAVQNPEEAVHELRCSPAQALVVNAPTLAETRVSMDCLAGLPYNTPTVTCWIPGEEEAAKSLDVVRYLVKPITRETLLSTLNGLGKVRNVLVVDDTPDAVQLFTRMLSSTQDDYHVLQAVSGQQALDILRDRHPDVMLLDLIMPEMDGFQVLEEKRRDPTIREVPVVVISARDPVGEVIVSTRLTVTRSNGLTVPEILSCIRTLSKILAPSSRRPIRAQSGEQAHPGKPAA